MFLPVADLSRSTRPPADIALCFNAGSSSLKFALFRVDAQGEHNLASGAVEQLGTASANASLNVDGVRRERPCANASASEALSAALALLGKERLPRATVVGHRVVHGGRNHVSPTRVDSALLASLKELVPMAPLHLPAAIASIEAVMALLPDVPHVACFDTAFHAGLPEYAARFALPSELYEQGIRRYGFHGLSYEYVLSSLGAFPPNRLIIAHLGNGASVAAVREGRSVDTTMGFTPSGGIMMGTRAGDLDPGVLLYLQRERGYSLTDLARLVDHESGLLGVGGSADLKTLSDRQEQDPSAHLAILMLGYSVRKTIGAYFAALGGLDLLVFTGGIGEHSKVVREEACRGLEALGIRLDDAKNASSQREIQAGPCPVLVIPTDEDRMIARHARAVLRAG
jgi:acetate kinase